MSAVLIPSCPYKTLMLAALIPSLLFFPSHPAILRILSAVLLFGNIEFKQERNSDQAALPDNTGKLQYTICPPIRIDSHSVCDDFKSVVE